MNSTNRYVALFSVAGNPGLGMQLSLSDFGSAGKPLDIPSKKWEDILAISVLPGPLDSLCVHMAQCPDQWLVWYKSVRPERLALPTIADSDQPGRSSLRQVHDRQAVLNSTWFNLY